MAFGERLGGLGTLHTAAPPPHFPILAFHCWIGFQLNNTYIVHECVNIKQQWSKNTDKYVLDYSEVLHLRQPICDQKNETPKKTQLRPPRTPPRLRHNHQPTITQNPTNQPPPRHRTPTPNPQQHSPVEGSRPPPPSQSRAPHARRSRESGNPGQVRGAGRLRLPSRPHPIPPTLTRAPSATLTPQQLLAVPMAQHTYRPLSRRKREPRAGAGRRVRHRRLPCASPPAFPQVVCIRRSPWSCSQPQPRRATLSPCQQHTASTHAPKRPSPAGSASTTTCASAPDSRRLFVFGENFGVVANLDHASYKSNAKTTSTLAPMRPSKRRVRIDEPHALRRN